MDNATLKELQRIADTLSERIDQAQSIALAAAKMNSLALYILVDLDLTTREAVVSGLEGYKTTARDDTERDVIDAIASEFMNAHDHASPPSSHLSLVQPHEKSPPEYPEEKD